MSPSDSTGNPARDGVSRRDFLRVGGLGVISLSAAERARRAAFARERAGNRRCLQIVLNGGMSQVDTFDPKPQAPLEFRGPFRPISTSVPSLLFTEGFPRLARLADLFTVVRSLHTTAAAVHETGLQLIRTGRLRTLTETPPDLGSLVSRYLGDDAEHPTYAVLGGRPFSSRVRGVVAPPTTSETAPETATPHTPWIPDSAELSDPASVESWRGRESDATRADYGESEFGRACLRARQLLEQDFRFITVHSMSHWLGLPSWDCHGSGPTAPLTVSETAPLARQCDQVLGALLEDLSQRGLLAETLVVITTEFGRTPLLNRAGGRDHWTRAWSSLIAGGAATGGAFGATDARGGEPTDNSVTPADIAATVLSHFTAGAATSTGESSLASTEEGDFFRLAVPQGQPLWS